MHVIAIKTQIHAKYEEALRLNGHSSTASEFAGNNFILSLLYNTGKTDGLPHNVERCSPKVWGFESRAFFQMVEATIRFCII